MGSGQGSSLFNSAIIDEDKNYVNKGSSHHLGVHKLECHHEYNDVIINHPSTTEVNINDANACHRNVDVYRNKENVTNGKVKAYELRLQKQFQGKNVLVSVKMRNTILPAIVDTAAQVCVMNTDFYQQIFGDTLKKGPAVHIKGIGKGLLHGFVALDMPFSFANRTFKWNVFVVPMEEKFILGLDFLLYHRVTLDLDKNTLCVKEKTEEIDGIKEGNGNVVQTSQVKLVHKVVVPPKTAMVLSCATTLPDGLFMVRPTGVHKKLLVPHVLVEGNEKVNINIVNDSDQYIYLKKNRVMGVAMEIAEILEDEDEVTSNPNKNDYQNSGEDSESGNHTCDNHCKFDKPQKWEGKFDDFDNKCDTTVNVDGSVLSCQPSTLNQDKNKEFPGYLEDLYNRSVKNLTASESARVKQLLTDYSDIFSSSDTDIGCFSEIKHKIDTGDAKPVKQALRRCPMKFAAEEKKHLDAMQAAGVIQESWSNWACNPVLVRKKDGGVRWCIDYRLLNNVTVKDAYPLPSINQCIDSLEGTKYFSCLDMTSGYWQVEIDEADRHKTAFITQYGLFEHR